MRTPAALARALALATIALLLAGPPAGANGPQPLTRSQAQINLKRVIELEFGNVIENYRRACVRRRSLRFVCRVAWRGVAGARLRGTVELTRSGTALNRIDRYALRIRETESICLGSCRKLHRRSGQLVSAIRRARFGQSLALLARRTSLLVTTVGLVDPAPPPQFRPPGAGTRYLGVHVVPANTGRDRHFDELRHGARIVTGERGTLRPEIIVTAPCDGTVLVPAGETRAACLLFESPFGTQVHAFELTPSSGFGPETGQWLL